jgi:serine/threonine protein kinase
MSQPWKLHGYVVERLLGTGGSGEVWRARVAATGEPVALKRLTQIDSRQLRRIHSEAALLSALEHPNLIRLHAVVEDGDTYVLVLDLADGGSLADLLTTRACLTPGEVVTAVAPVAAALAYAHGQGVVHGDVSAANPAVHCRRCAALGRSRRGPAVRRRHRSREHSRLPGSGDGRRLPTRPGK